MDKPSKFAFSEEATFSFTQGTVLIPTIIIVSVFVVGLVTTDATLSELGLPFVAISGMVLIIVGVFGSVALGHRFFEKRAINRLFSGEIWECWRFSAAEWKSQVEKVCNQINPPNEGREAYSGVIASSIFGAVIAIIMSAIVFFAVKDPSMKKILWFTAGGVLLLFVGAGLFEPVVEKYKAAQYRRRAMQVKEPRVWFGPDGVYHEALGHTSLKELHRVTDQTKSRNAIQFSVVFSSDTYDDLVKIRFPVPSGCKERAARLVLRYRNQRLSS